MASPNCLACIDASHLDAFGGYPWLEAGLHGDPAEVHKDDPRRDGIGGFEMHLMRNGYLPIRLAELSPEQLQRTGLLVSISPSRACSEDETAAIHKFLEGGGIWVCMVGADRCEPINAALAAFGLSVPPTHLGAVPADAERPAISRVTRRYVHVDDYDAYAVFDSAWPVLCENADVETLIQGQGEPPVAVSVAVGKGRIILIGDRLFAANRNLENEEGTIVNGVRENAAFWRWLIVWARDRQDWPPPNIPLPEAPAEDEDDADAAAPEPPAANAPAEKPLPGKTDAGKTGAGKTGAGKTAAGKGLGAARLLGTRPKAVPGKEATP